MHISNRSRRDVVVVGGRVAGSATAMLLARLGHDVVVVDQASFLSDTTSTHAIARSGVVQLRRWGLLDAVLANGRFVKSGSARPPAERRLPVRGFAVLLQSGHEAGHAGA